MKILTVAGFVLVSWIVLFPPNAVFAMGGGSDDKQELGNKYSDGIEAIKQERYQDAIASLKGSLLENPGNADIENLLGFSYRQLKNYEMAFEHYKNALRIDAKHKGALEYMGIAYLEVGDRKGAEKLFASLKELCAFCKERRSLGKAIKAFGRKKGQSD